jgi:hypothetical protein
LKRDVTVAEENTEAPQAAAVTVTAPDIARAFVSVVRKVPHVQQVLVDDPEYVRHVWTVISAPPFEDRYRLPVYEAELGALEQTGYPTIDFRLINMQEVAADLSSVLPSSYHTVYRR